jgi:D-inositol-3-phosphate glycosyltransferase
VKILLTSHRFWPHVGGTEVAVQMLAERYSARGHDVTVATSMEPGASADERRGYRIRRFELRRIGKFRFPPKEYVRFVIDGDWDVIHLVGQRVWSTDYLYRHLRGAKAGLAFTAFGLYQRHMERTPVLDTLYYGSILPRALNRCSAVIASTESERAELRTLGVRDELVRVIPLGFDPAEFIKLPHGFRARHALPSRPILLYVGGFYPNKRVDLLVRIAAATSAHLVVIGKDQDPARGRSHCEALARSLGAQVSFLGPLPRQEVLAAYAEGDLFLFASEFEGFGLVLIEALAAGLPVVSTPVGVAPDLASVGAAVIGHDEAALASAVRGLLDHPERRKAMSEIARRVARDFSWDRVADQHLALYEEVARR